MTEMNASRSWLRSVIIVLTVTATYFVSGRLGLQLAIPPGYATVIWPPSGIALAAVLLGGYRVWPGVLLGSLLVNLSIGIEADPAAYLLSSLTIPALIACGAALQAVGGGFLVRRFGGFPNPLRTMPQISTLLVLGGAVACVINASIGVATLYAFGRIPFAGVSSTWATWWIGDTIGVLVFTPVALATLMRPRADWKHRSGIIVASTVTTFLMMMGMVAYTSYLEHKDSDAKLKEVGDNLTGSLTMVLSGRLHSVTALTAFLSHSSNISADEFAQFSTNLRLGISGVITLEWIPRVPSEQRDAFEAAARGWGLSDFQILDKTATGFGSAAKRREYYPVTFVDPIADNIRAVGFDLASVENRRQTLAQARETGKIAVTERVSLVQGGEAVLAVAPVYHDVRDAIGGVRQTSMAGFALGVVRITDIDKDSFQGYDVSDIHYWLIDETSPSDPIILAANISLPPSAFAFSEHGLFGSWGTIAYQRDIDPGGRRWVLHVAPTQEFITKHRIKNAWIVLVGGMFATGLMTAFTMLLTGRDGELVGQVEERTAALHATLEQLAQTEARYRTLFTKAKAAMMLVDPDSGAVVDANAVASEFYGYHIERLRGMQVSDINILSPEEIERELEAARRENRNHFDFRHRMANGDIRDVEVHSGPIDIDGRTLLFSIIHDSTARKKAERSLVMQSARYQQILKTASDGIHIVDHDGVLVEANASFLRMLGYNDTIIGNLRVQDWDTQDPWEVIKARNDNLIDRQGTMTFETRHLRHDGVIMDVEINASGIEIDGKKLIYASSRDITQRKQIEAQLRESEERFRSLVEGTTDWVWESDSDHCFTWFSPSFEPATGVLITTILGKRRWDMASKDREIDAALWQAHIGDLTAHRAFRDFRYWIRTDNGKAKWISINGTPHYDHNSNFLGYRGSGSDITAQAEQSMRLRMLSTAVEQSPVSVIITDTEGAIEYVNSYFTTVTGYEAVEVLGKNPRLLASGDTSPEVYKDMWEAISSGHRWIGELKNKRKNGQLYWESLTTAPVRSDDGKITHYVAVKEDITKSRQLQDELRKTNAELEQVSYVASHDLRQPLRMVTAYLGLIEKRLPPESLSDDIKTFLDYAVGGAKRMDRLIIDLLEYSRTGKSAKFVPVSVDEAVADAKINLTVAIHDADAKIASFENLPTIMADPTELTRLFQNLIGNAVKYHAPDRRPEIKIACQRKGREWLISVSDNGIGIAPEDRERAFVIFQRLVAQDAYEGTGIGLAVCKKIVETHGGRIWIESEVGVGSTFFMTFPAIESEPERQ